MSRRLKPNTRYRATIKLKMPAGRYGRNEAQDFNYEWEFKTGDLRCRPSGRRPRGR